MHACDARKHAKEQKCPWPQASDKKRFFRWCVCRSRRLFPAACVLLRPNWAPSSCNSGACSSSLLPRTIARCPGSCVRRTPAGGRQPRRQAGWHGGRVRGGRRTHASSCSCVAGAQACMQCLCRQAGCQSLTHASEELVVGVVKHLCGLAAVQDMHGHLVAAEVGAGGLGAWMVNN